jgi:hypothetical protein
MVNRNVTAGAVLRGYFNDLDGPMPELVLERLAPDFRFTILFADDDGAAEEFSGGTLELKGYLDKRGPAEWWHDLMVVDESGDLAVATGQTRRGDEVIAKFMTTMQVDPHGRVVRYFAARVTDAEGWS